MKIAYVEDDRDARSVFGERLEAEGHECGFFDSGEQLLKTITPGSYDALIVDIRLPEMSGIEMIRRLRERGIETPCILITAFNSMEYARDALNANANYLLEKPFRYHALVRAIQTVTSSSVSVQHCVDRGIAQLALTDREVDVARLVLKGFSNNEIADILKISDKTVKQYLTQIFQKAGTASRGEFFASIFPV